MDFVPVLPETRLSSRKLIACSKYKCFFLQVLYPVFKKLLFDHTFFSASAT